MAKIKLTETLPVGEEHGCTKGRIFEVIRLEKGQGAKVVFMGDAGEEVTALYREYERVPIED